MTWCTLFTIAALMLYHVADAGESVLLDNVETLVFRKGAMTSARRGVPRPQQNCDTKEACESATDYIVCNNIGSTDATVFWHCETTMKQNHRIDNVVIVCEGYEYKNDPNILRDSCSISFSTVTQSMSSAHTDGMHRIKSSLQITYCFMVLPAILAVSSRSVIKKLAAMFPGNSPDEITQRLALCIAAWLLWMMWITISDWEIPTLSTSTYILSATIWR